MEKGIKEIMASNIEKVPKLFSQLQLAGEDGDFEWGLEVAEEILKISPNDEDALLCRLVSLIQLSEYEEAIGEINRLSKVAGKQIYLYEKAYCQYKLEQYRKSLDTLSNVSAGEQASLRVLDLTAQIHYRLEEYKKSASIFQKSRSLQDSQERSVNMVAAASYCGSDTISCLLTESPVSTDTMEQCFNLATAYLNAYADEVHAKEAESLLQKSKQFCEENIASNPDDEDAEQELIPVHIQLAYTLQCQGRFEEAMRLYSLVLKEKPSSVVHTMTAANNVLVLNRDKDVFDSKKKIKIVSNEAGLKKLNSRQHSVVLFNRCLFALQINQLEQCRQLLQEFKQAFHNTEEVVLVESALLNREKRLSECFSVLEQYLESTQSSVLVYLTLAQLYSMQGNQAKAREVLEKIPSIAKYLGIVSVLVSQYASIGTDDAQERIRGLLDRVFNYWKSRKEAPSSVREGILWTIGQYKLQHGHPEEAAEIFDHLYNLNKSNVSYLANLISAYSRYNAKRAEELGRQLSQSYVSSSVVDVEALEQMPSFRHTRRQVAKSEVAKQVEKPADVSVSMTESKAKKKKKRKQKLPKNFDPAKPPDPERWLPLRERSYYRKSKKKGQQSGVGRGTQGLSAASASLAAKLDASKPKADESTSKDQREVASPRTKSVPQHHKKKKKGRR